MQRPSEHPSERDLRESVRRLRRELHALAGEESFTRIRFRYRLRASPSKPLGLYRRLRVSVGLLLRRLGLRKLPPWLAPLRSSDCPDDARPLVIWAIGIDPETLRLACQRLQSLLADRRDYAPVLVTDVADFAFFSRLAWLVEYVPTLAPPAHGYALRKQRYLASRYRGAPAVPADAVLDPRVDTADLMAAVDAKAYDRAFS